jgi:hypothetical protein
LSVVAHREEEERKKGGKWRQQERKKGKLGFAELHGGLKGERGKHRSRSILVVGAIT